jgi:3-hydroxybutyryl-CoA dehydratase
MATLQTKGLYFEEFDVGMEAISPGRTVTESDIMLFAGLSGDYNPLHCDAEYAQGTVFGERIAHGLLGLSIASGLASRLGFMEGTVEAFLGLEWKFRAPIKIGDTIRVVAKVAQTRPMGAQGGIVVFDVQLRNQRDEVAQRGQWTVLAKSKPSAQW